MTGEPLPSSNSHPDSATGERRTYTVADALAFGMQRLEAGDLNAADHIFRQVLKAEPHNLEALRCCAVVAERLGRSNASVVAVEQALATAATPTLHAFAIGHALRTLGLYDEAIALYRRAVALNPDFAEAHCDLGTTYKEIGWLDEAIVVYQEAVRAKPDFALAYSNLGVALKDKGRLEEAVAAYTQAIAIDPTMAQAHCNLGVALKDLGRIEEAIEAYRRAIAIQPNFAVALTNLGNALKALDRIDEAVAAYRQAMATNPRFGQPYANVAAIALKRGDAKAALGICDDYLARFGMNCGVLACKVMALEEVGRRDEARFIADYDRLVRPVRIAVPTGFKCIADFNLALATHVLNHRSLKFSPSDHATRQGLHSGELLAGDKGPVAILQDQIVEAVQHYLDTMIGDARHPFLKERPRLSCVSAWAVILEAQGHQVPHIHPTAWLSGVYYVKVPKVVATPGNRFPGWIEFGATGEEYAFRTSVPDVKAFQPEEGKMFLFPSYLYHRTIPFETNEKRISIAFDIW
jgi:uncharacterized protein (TIGR02466 family)